MLDIEKIKEVLKKDERIVFAYIFGSYAEGDKNFRDVDIGIYCKEDFLEKPFEVTSDLKVALYRETSEPADLFDIVIINFLFNSEELDSLILLGEIFDGVLLVDRDPDLRTDLIERISRMFLEAEGLMKEAYS